MRESQTLIPEREETPVDDVRRIRERLDREAGGDVGRLLEQSHEFFEKHWKSLGLKRGPSHTRQGRCKGRVTGPREETPVDDVRRIRERLSREAGGDVHRLMEGSSEATDRHTNLVGPKRVSLDASPRTRARRRAAAKRSPGRM